MRYVKITTENADILLGDGVILAHSQEVWAANELDEIIEDKLIDIVQRVDSRGVTVIMPDATSTARYELDYFTNGHWWLKDFSKVQQPEDNGFKYIPLLVSILLFSLSIYMYVDNVTFTGYYGPGRTGGFITKGNMPAWFVFLVGLAFFGMFVIFLRNARKR